MFLVASDFDDYPYELPDLDNKVNTFQPFVDVEEEVALRKVLGKLLYEEFKARVSDSLLTVSPIPLTPRWLDLKNGKDYTFNAKKSTWVGIKTLLKPYIYAQWTKRESDNQNGSGVSVPKLENSTVISSTQRVSRAFNVYSHISGHRRTLTDSLYGFLFNSGDTYLDVVISEYTSIQGYIRFNYKDPGLINMFNL